MSKAGNEFLARVPVDQSESSKVELVAAYRRWLSRASDSAVLTVAARSCDTSFQRRRLRPCPEFWSILCWQMHHQRRISALRSS